jgi:hypothetical protein
MPPTAPDQNINVAIALPLSAADDGSGGLQGHGTVVSSAPTG